MEDSNKQIGAMVGDRLRSLHDDWDTSPEQGIFSRTRILERAKNIHDAVADVTGLVDYLGIDEALEKTRLFVDNAFDAYEGSKDSERFDWVFAVPGRIEDHQNGRYASEVTPFLPILGPEFGVDDITRQNTTTSLAPSVIETYVGDESVENRGAIVWTPFHVDSAARVGVNEWRRFVHSYTPGIRQSVNETADFVAQRLGAKVMGLGASIPAFTRLGKTITTSGLTTTTGHAGTVHLLHETFHVVMNDKDPTTRRVGLLGTGAVGRSWAGLALNDGLSGLNVYDRDDQQVERLLAHTKEGVAMSPQLNEVSLLRSSDVIVSAINRTLDLDQLEWMHKTKIDLSGKVIIDDSQPGAFDRQAVEERGGTLVWVVGQDTSVEKRLHRSGGYNFGDTAGLYGNGSVWGCEAEVAALYLQAREDLAVRSHVTPEMALAVGALCREIGITVSSPLQSFGRPIDLDSGFLPSVSGL